MQGKLEKTKIMLYDMASGKTRSFQYLEGDLDASNWYGFTTNRNK